RNSSTPRARIRTAERRQATAQLRGRRCTLASPPSARPELPTCRTSFRAFHVPGSEVVILDVLAYLKLVELYDGLVIGLEVHGFQDHSLPFVVSRVDQPYVPDGGCLEELAALVPILPFDRDEVVLVHPG